ncbi:hypothetical protein FHT10_002636 [Xanthomonas arboricola]|nr:hypothetical protein [Xanthomonas cannabis]
MRGATAQATGACQHGKALPHRARRADGADRSRDASGSSTAEPLRHCAQSLPARRKVAMDLNWPPRKFRINHAMRMRCRHVPARSSRGLRVCGAHAGPRHLRCHIPNREGSMAASMPLTVPQPMRTPRQTVGWWFCRRIKTACRGLSLLVENFAHRPTRLVLARPPSRDPWRHGCRQGAIGTYLQRVPRWWAGKGPAAKAKMIRFPPDLPVLSSQIETAALCVSRSLGCLHVWSNARRPHRLRDTP